MMRAVLGKSVISVRDFVDLKVGDVIRLQNRTTQMSQVYAHKKHFFNAVVGTRNKRLAFRITSVIEGEEDEESS
jgi:flagellar motor switch protein FliM